MNAKQFVACWHREKSALLEAFTNPDSESIVAAKLAALELSDEQSKALSEAIDLLLTDSFYTLLVGLDGGASIGGVQQPYQLRDENGDLVAETGDLETEAFDQFYADSR